MFGKGFVKIIGLAISGAIALAAGSQVLSSVVSVVLAFRYGNYLPLAIVVSLTICIPLVNSRIPEKSHARNILRIMQYMVTGYFAVIVFVLTLPFGLVISIIVVCTVGILPLLLNDPKVFHEAVTQFHISPTCFIREINRATPMDDRTSFKPSRSHKILILAPGVRQNLLNLMKERPLLPISYVHFEECDAVFITSGIEPRRYESLLSLFKTHNIGIQTASPLLAEALQMIPLLDSRNGLKFEDYGLVRDEKTITSILELIPSRLTIFPTRHGLNALVLYIEAPGLNIEHIADGQEIEVILNRNYTLLEGAEIPIERTT